MSVSLMSVSKRKRLVDFLGGERPWTAAIREYVPSPPWPAEFFVLLPYYRVSLALKLEAARKRG